MNPIKVATGLLLRDGAVLMCQRKGSKIYPLHWEFPGGKLEPGESSEQALHRELFEELHISIANPEAWWHEVATYSNGITYDLTYYLIREFEGELHNTEFESIAWIEANQLSELQHLSGNANIIALLIHEGIPR